MLASVCVLLIARPVVICVVVCSENLCERIGAVFRVNVYEIRVRVYWLV